MRRGIPVIAVLSLNAIPLLIPGVSLAATQLVVHVETGYGDTIPDEEMALTLVNSYDQRDYSDRLKRGRGKVPNGYYELSIKAIGFRPYNQGLALSGGERGVLARLTIGEIDHVVVRKPPTRLAGQILSAELPFNEYWIRMYRLDDSPGELAEAPVDKNGKFTIHEPRSGNYLLAVFHRPLQPPDRPNGPTTHAFDLLHSQRIDIRRHATTHVEIKLDRPESEPE